MDKRQSRRKRHFKVIATYTDDNGKEYEDTFPFVPAKSKREAGRKVREQLSEKYMVVAATLKVKPVREEQML